MWWRGGCQGYTETEQAGLGIMGTGMRVEPFPVRIANQFGYFPSDNGSGCVFGRRRKRRRRELSYVSGGDKLGSTTGTPFMAKQYARNTFSTLMMVMER